MRYVIYYTFGDAEPIPKFFIKKDEKGFVYLSNPFCYEWLKSINRLDLFELVNVTVLDEKFFLFKENPSYHPIKPESWMFSFPFKDKDVRYLNFLSIFYEEYMFRKHKPLTLRLEELIDEVSFFIPEELLGRLLLFVLKNTTDDPDRVRLMFSPKIQQYIKGDAYFEIY